MADTTVSTIGIADDMVRASVRALMAGRRHNYATLAEAVGMSDETLRRKLTATGPRKAFTAGELTVLADHFGRTLDDLVTGLGGMVTLPGPGNTCRYNGSERPQMTPFAAPLPRLRWAS